MNNKNKIAQKLAMPSAAKLIEEKNLDRGDLKIKSGEIEIDEIFSKKVIFNSDFDKSFLLNDKKD